MSRPGYPVRERESAMRGGARQLLRSQRLSGEHVWPASEQARKGDDLVPSKRCRSESVRAIDRVNERKESASE